MTIPNAVGIELVRDARFCQTINVIKIRSSCIENKECLNVDSYRTALRNPEDDNNLSTLWTSVFDFDRIDFEILGNVYLQAIFIWINYFVRLFRIRKVDESMSMRQTCLKIGKVFFGYDRNPQSYLLNMY